MFQMRICNQKPSNVLKTRTNKIGNNMTMGNKGRLFLHRIKKEKKNAQSHVRLGQNQPTAAPKKRQCSTTNFIADNSMEDTNIHVQNKVLQLPTKQSTIYKSNQTYGQNHLEKQRKIICVKNKGNMNQNDHMQQGKNNSNAYKVDKINGS
ncbi:uncharacterized protein [Oryza sativa Japonica Group]|uniref:uncharacterized protein isoform X5 n=1 Tax=Oryza sativa subsp. japonica TaxID=39947 RepID=UPI0007753A0C|nr:uncharacterized protein LOC4338062 isoform X11 [Oryza sativa Japonica Group]